MYALLFASNSWIIDAGYLVKGERQFACSERTKANKAKGLGVVLTSNNMNDYQKDAICKECTSAGKKKICTYKDCKNQGTRRGQRCATHQEGGVKICTYKDCKYQGWRRGQRCATHEGL